MRVLLAVTVSLPLLGLEPGETVALDPGVGLRVEGPAARALPPDYVGILSAVEDGALHVLPPVRLSRRARQHRRRHCASVA